MIETKDLLLAKGRPEDWRAMYDYVWSRPSSFRYMILELSPSEEEARERMARTVAFQSQRQDAYTVFLKSTGEAIGFTGIAPFDGEIPAPGPAWEETGICLGPDFWGRGYGWQVLQRLLALAEERGAKTFVYSAWEENAASRALAEKAGFQEYAREAHTRPHDGLAYTLIKYKYIF